MSSTVAQAYVPTITPVRESRITTVDFSHLPFGTIFSDHMLVANFTEGRWQQPTIMPYGELTMSPALSALHYGQSIFEGMKAYRNNQGQIRLFRPLDHLERLNRSAERLCMPEVPADLFIDGLKTLVQLDRAWVPDDDNSSLYIRPLYFGTDEYVGVHPSENNRLVIFTCPVSTFYKGGVKAYLTTDYTRSSEGGVGFVKTSGNYARAMYAGVLAKKKGLDVVLWLDASHRKYIEEFSTMNVFVVIGDTVITPELNDSILAGITRDSIIHLLRDEGFNVQERPINIDEIIEASHNGTLREVFGTGTAAVISPVASLHFDHDTHPALILPPYENWKVAPLARQRLRELRAGTLKDRHHWLMPIE
jgi:branched-chain amino acid aminotransferase